jgi:hypothetical protein
MAELKAPRIESWPNNDTTTWRKRHWALTAWLILTLIAFSLTLLLSLGRCARFMLITTDLEIPPWPWIAGGVVGGIGILATIAILNWKRWGFYTDCVLAVIAAAFNVYSHTPSALVLLGLAGPFVLYGLLRLGGANCAWRQMR